MSKAITWRESDKRKIDKAFKQSAEGKAIVGIGAAAFKTALTDGLSNSISSNQASWKPLSKSYAAAKGSDTKWVKSGRLRKAITNNAPIKEGIRKGVLFKIDWKRLNAYIIYKGFKTDGDKRAVYFLLNKNRPLFVWSKSNKTNLETNIQTAINTALSDNGFKVEGTQ